MKNSKYKGNYIKRIGRNIYKEWELYLLVLPAVIYFIIFKYIPMYGVQIAFKDYIPGMESMFKAEWVGFYNFQRFFQSYKFWNVVFNTLRISLMSLFLGFPFPVILAIMLNELRNIRFKKTLQTISYAPHFISTVGMAGIILVFLSSSGLFNNILKIFGMETYQYMADPKLFPWIYVIQDIWKNSGWGSIIYIAALAGVDPQLYEAAKLDGATIWQKIWHIDIPSILPTMIILLILRCGRIMTVGFELILLLQNVLNNSTSEVISTFVYKVGLASANSDFGYATAIGLFNSGINLILLMTVNFISRKTTETSMW